MKIILWCVSGVAIVVGAFLWVLMQPVFWGTQGALPPAVDSNILEAHVRVLSETFHPRNFEKPENLEAAASYIHDFFVATGAAVEDQIYDVDGHSVRNVIARFGPADGPLIVVGAHYDSEASSRTPGADDNASGVAGLLELARLLQGKPLSKRVELVAYTLEEPPFFATDTMGSAAHARYLRSANQDVELMIALEMIGFFSDEADTQGYPVSALGLLYPDRGDFISIIGRISEIGVTRTAKQAMMAAMELPVYSMNAVAEIPGVDFSDHRNYWKQGYPALMVTDTAFYRNSNYHRESDTANTLDYARMGNVVQGVFAVIEHLAGKEP